MSVNGKSLGIGLALCAALLVLVKLFVDNVEPSKPAISPEALDWMIHQTKRFPPGGGWIVGDVKPVDGDIQVQVVIPSDQAAALMAQPPADQFRIIEAVMCPSQVEPVWAILDARQNIVISAASVDTPDVVFINAPCRGKQ